MWISSSIMVPRSITAEYEVEKTTFIFLWTLITSFEPDAASNHNILICRKRFVRKAIAMRLWDKRHANKEK
jgi:hypothetical protein